MRQLDVDVVVISTLPPGFSRWLRRDVPARVSRRFPHIRVIDVVANAASAAAGRDWAGGPLVDLGREAERAAR